jgi:hypothetical protein
MSYVIELGRKVMKMTQVVMKNKIWRECPMVTIQMVVMKRILVRIVKRRTAQ